MKTPKLIISILAAASLSWTAAIAGDGVPKDYPLKTCVVSGESFGGDMKPFKVTYNETDVWLCCKGCKKKFDADPVKYTKIVTDAKK